MVDMQSDSIKSFNKTLCNVVFQLGCLKFFKAGAGDGPTCNCLLARGETSQLGQICKTANSKKVKKKNVLMAGE